MAQGHTETTCKVSSPGSSGAKAQAVRYPILPPPWFVQGWDGRRLVYLGLERFFCFLDGGDMLWYIPWLWALLLCCVHEAAVFISSFTAFTSAWCVPSADLP